MYVPYFMLPSVEFACYSREEFQLKKWFGTQMPERISPIGRRPYIYIYIYIRMYTAHTRLAFAGAPSAAAADRYRCDTGMTAAAAAAADDEVRRWAAAR
jgi:hypothetical protein